MQIQTESESSGSKTSPIRNVQTGTTAIVPHGPPCYADANRRRLEARADVARVVRVVAPLVPHPRPAPGRRQAVVAGTPKHTVLRVVLVALRLRGRTVTPGVRRPVIRAG